MIPEIGLMVGWYIVAKMVYISGNDDATITVKILCGISIIIALFVMADLFLRGTDMANMFIQSGTGMK